MTRITIPALASGALLLLAACGGSAAPASSAAAPSVAPASAAAKPSAAASAAAPASAAASAKPAVSTSAAAKPAASGAASAKPAASGAASAKPAAAASSARPAVKFAYSSPGFSYIPMFMAQDAMKAMGYPVDSATFNQPELAVQAISSNETQFSSGSTYTVMQAIQKGAKVKLIADRNANEWTITAANAVDCSNLTGKKVAIASEGAVSTAMLNQWLKDKCPQAKPNILVIADSDQRGAAMLAGQLDASPLQLDSQVVLYKKGPGKFHTLADLSKDLPQLDTSAIYVSDDFLSKNRPAVVDFVTELIKANRAVTANPALLKENNAKYKFGGEDVIDDISKAYLGINAFDKNGGVTEDRINYSIDFFVNGGQLKPGLKASDVADLSVVKDALAKVGA